MECRQLEVTVISANDVYAVLSVNGNRNPLCYSPEKQKTHHTPPVHKDSGPNPRWGHTIYFTLDEDSLQKNRLSLDVDLFSDSSLGDRQIGELHVPLKELLDQKTSAPVSYAVSSPSGEQPGTLTFSFKFSDKMPAPAKDKLKATGEPPLAYPAGTSGYGGYAAPPPQVQAFPYPPQKPAYGGYPPPPQVQAYPYPPQVQAYPYPPQQPAYGGYPPQQPAYGGYPPQQPGYGYPPQPGYGYPPPPGYYGGYPQQPPMVGNNGGLMGAGAHLLAGARLLVLLIGNTVSDVWDGSFDV